MFKDIMSFVFGQTLLAVKLIVLYILVMSIVNPVNAAELDGSTATKAQRELTSSEHGMAVVGGIVGYYVGAVAGVEAAVALAAVPVTVTTATGATIAATAAPATAVIGGLVVGAVTGAVVGYQAVKLYYVHKDDIKEVIVDKAGEVRATVEGAWNYGKETAAKHF